MEKWEYKTFMATGPELEEALPKWGEAGWELVIMVPFGYGAEKWDNAGVGTQQVAKWGAEGYRVVFKRRKP